MRASGDYSTFIPDGRHPAAEQRRTDSPRGAAGPAARGGEPRTEPAAPHPSGEPAPRSAARRGGGWLPGAYACGAAVLLLVASSWADAEGEGSGRPPSWLLEQDFGRSGEAAASIRSALVRHRISEDQFWRLQEAHLSQIFPDRVGYAVAVSDAISRGPSRERLEAMREAMNSTNSEDLDDYYRFDTDLQWNVFASGVFCLAVAVMFIVTRRALEQEKQRKRSRGDEQLDRFSNEYLLHVLKNEANIYRMVAVVDWDTIRNRGRSPLLFVILAWLAAWMQIYIPWRSLQAALAAAELQGLKKPSWFASHFLSVFTSLSALVTMAVIFMKSVQISMFNETLHVFHLLVYVKGDNELATSSVTTPWMASRLSMRRCSGGRSAGNLHHPHPAEVYSATPFCGCVAPDRWESFWCHVSLFTTYWSGFVLSLAMLMSIASYNGDSSTFVLNAMKMFFLMGVDEKIMDCFPAITALFVQERNAQTTRDPDAYQQYIRVFKPVGIFITATCDMFLAVGLLVLCVTFWTDPSGAIVGVGAAR